MPTSTLHRVGALGHRHAAPLSTAYPDVLLHPERNKRLSEDDLTFFDADQECSWLCPTDPCHTWVTTVSLRVRRPWVRCPQCSVHAAAEREAQPWFTVIDPLHPTRNRHPFADYDGPGLRWEMESVFWLCEVDPDHIWVATPEKRRYGRGFRRGRPLGCQGCMDAADAAWATWRAATAPPRGLRLADRHPDLRLHPDGNHGLTATDLWAHGDPRVLRWRCPVSKTHDWRSTVQDRLDYESTCKACAEQRHQDYMARNSLAARHPDLAVHPTRNAQGGADSISANHSGAVHWLCEVNPDHVWRVGLKGRLNSGSRCPGCKDQAKAARAAERLSDLPDLRLHPDGNGTWTAEGLTQGSGRRMRWLCPVSIEHAWVAPVYVRVRGQSVCATCKVGAAVLPAAFA